MWCGGLTPLVLRAYYLIIYSLGKNDLALKRLLEIKCYNLLDTIIPSTKPFISVDAVGSERG